MLLPSYLEIRSNPESDPDPKFPEKSDPDPKKIVSDPQHFFQLYLHTPLFKTRVLSSGKKYHTLVSIKV